jgi:hypothetical protein
MTAMIGWGELTLLATLAALPLLPAGLILLVVGLATHRRGLWTAGLVMLIVVFFVLSSAAVAYTWQAVARGPGGAPPRVALAPPG